MFIIRILLFPFSVIYGFVTFLRNKLYDIGFYRQVSFEIPIISVGNLSVGGTGKTPHIEYLIRLFSGRYKIATLSRGYGRKTRGFFIADVYSNARDIGDEPMQFHQKFSDVTVAVDENRVNGVNKLLYSEKRPELILLDDAFQHRRIKPGFQVLLTPFGDLYCDDDVLPAGRLREYRSGSNRADVIVVTKSPDKVDEHQVKEIKKKLKVRDYQELFFSRIVYDNVVYGLDKTMEFAELQNYTVLLVTGIANPYPLIKHLKSYDIIVKHLNFTDHHDFKKDDIDKIESEFASLGSGKKVILTTEKDFVRLGTIWNHNGELMYLPISVDFLNGDKAAFDKKITDYVRENKGNS